MISIVLIFFAGICNAIMDVLKYRWNICIFKSWPNQNWINPSISWKNKWNSKNKIVNFLMSTIFVFITDFWHFCKFLMILFLISAIVFYIPYINKWVDLLIFYCTFTITFEIFFSKILVKN